MDLYSFSTSNETFSLTQNPKAEIGSKVYPAALILTAFLERYQSVLFSTSLPQKPLFIEIGIGAAALPSLFLTSKGASCIGTDVPSVLRLTEENFNRNFKNRVETVEVSRDLGSFAIVPLMWGDRDSVAHLADALRNGELPFSSMIRDVNASEGPNFIIAADVVYHEYLIDPLFQTLLALTDSKLTGWRENIPVYFTYVQRFQRAKHFFVLLRKYFDLEVLVTDLVIDYEALNWVLPILASYGVNSVPKSDVNSLPVREDSPYGPYNHMPHLRSQTCRFEAYVHALEQAARVKLDLLSQGIITRSDISPTFVNNHSIESDSDDEWANPDVHSQHQLESLHGASAAFESPSSSGYDTSNSTASERKAFSFSFDSLGHDYTVVKDNEIRGTSDPKVYSAGLSLKNVEHIMTRARKASRILGITLHEPLKAYVYLLRRKSRC